MKGESNKRIVAENSGLYICIFIIFKKWPFRDEFVWQSPKSTWNIVNYLSAKSLLNFFNPFALLSFVYLAINVIDNSHQVLPLLDWEGNTFSWGQELAIFFIELSNIDIGFVFEFTDGGPLFISQFPKYLAALVCLLDGLVEQVLSIWLLRVIMIVLFFGWHSVDLIKYYKIINRQWEDNTNLGNEPAILK